MLAGFSMNGLGERLAASPRESSRSCHLSMSSTRRSSEDQETKSETEHPKYGNPKETKHVTPSVAGKHGEAESAALEAHHLLHPTLSPAELRHRREAFGAPWPTAAPPPQSANEGQ